MNSQSRSYLLPSILSVCLLLSLGLWVADEFLDSYAQEIKTQKKVIETVSGMLQAEVNAAIENGTLDIKKLEFVLKNLALGTHIDRVSLRKGNETIIDVGKSEASPLPKNIPAVSQGRSSKGTRHIFWETIRLPEKISIADSETSTLRIICSLNANAFLPSGKYRGRLLLMAIVLGLGAITALFLAWSFLMRSRNLEERLKTARDHREQSEELSLAAAGLAHETKNPLGIIRGLAQQVANEKGNSQKAREMAREIMEQADITTSRLGDFLSYAKQREPELAEVNALENVGRIAALLDEDFSSAGVSLKTDIDNINILCDAEMLSQILMNLLMNSLKSSESGSETLISVKRRGQNNAFISVSDTGCGIPSEMLPNIFKPYVSKRANGYGIGLAIVKRIVEQSGWSISVESKQGKGTTITIKKIKTQKENE